MKYTREQDINAVIGSVQIGKPEKKKLVKRLFKKYGPKSVIVVLEAYEKMGKRKRGNKWKEKKK